MSSVKPKLQELREVIKIRLIPFILSRGFEFDKRELYKPDPYGHQIRRFMRWNGDMLELLDIQFAKRGGAKFVISVGVVPPEGVKNSICHYNQLEVDITRLPPRSSLYAGNRYIGRWFGLSTSKIPFLRKRSVDEVINLAIQLFPQAEAWLREGIVGPNMAGGKIIV